MIMQKKQKISIIVGVLVLIVGIVGNVGVWSEKPVNIQVQLDQTVENIATTKSMNLSEKSQEEYFADLLDECNMLEGEKPIRTIILVKDIPRFFSILEHNSIKEIHYAVANDDTAVDKIFWATVPMNNCELEPIRIFEIKESYESPNEFYYRVKRYNNTTITFEKSFLHTNGFLFQVVIFAIVGFIASIAYGITLTVLWTFDKIDKFIKRSQ